MIDGIITYRTLCQKTVRDRSPDFAEVMRESNCRSPLNP